MKTCLKLAAIALIAAVQPAFAVAIEVPDGGSTALLTMISVSGLLLARNLLKGKH